MNNLKKLTIVTVMVSFVILTSCSSYGRVAKLPLPFKAKCLSIGKKVEFDKLSPADRWYLLDKRDICRDGYERALEDTIKTTHD